MTITDADQMAALSWLTQADRPNLAEAFARHRESAFEDGVISTFSQRAMDLRDVEKRSHDEGFRAGALAMRQAAVKATTCGGIGARHVEQIIADAIAAIDPDTLEDG